MKVVIGVDDDRQHGDVVCMDQFGFRQRKRRVDRRYTVADEYANIRHVLTVAGTAEHNRTHFWKSRLQRRYGVISLINDVILSLQGAAKT